MKITTVAFNRFHIYDQARELDNENLLFKLITNYPKFRSRDFKISDAKVISLPLTGILNHLRIKLLKRINSSVNKKIVEYLHNKFSRDVAKSINVDTDIVIFLSSVGLEGIKFCQENNIISISDHGSGYQEYEKSILEEEREIFGLEKSSVIDEWIIKKEAAEFKLADFIFLGSNYAKETFLKYDYPENKLIVNNYGVDLENFKKIYKEDEIFRIIIVAGANVGKGVQYLLKAFNELNFENSELWVIGGGYPNKELDIIFAKMKINFNNIFFKGSFPQRELYKYYSQCSVFCLPSLSDGFGMVVPQALACGLPVIVSENTGAKDIVVQNYNGYVVPIRDIESIKEKILYLYENPETLKLMSVNALESVKDGLSWSDYGDRLMLNLKKIGKAK
jgi:glycosyltransferase involved in cell wall biosynthesis